MEGCQIFVDVLTQFAERGRDPRLRPIIRRIAAPVRVAVRGRAGAGVATVTRALADAGVVVAPAASVGDVTAVVVAETLKPEDLAMIADAQAPTVVILNKADLTGFGAGGPMALAHRRAADLRAQTGSPVVPMAGLLATTDLDDDLIGALRLLVEAPADLTSVDAFVESEHPVPATLRRRLIEALDRFGIAHAVLAFGEDKDAADVREQLRRLSLVDRVAAHLDAAGAPVRYRRLHRALVELRALAAQSDDEDLAEFLAADATVLAVMGAAVDVVEAAGVRVDRGDDARSHLRRAAHWKRYGNGPVNALHRKCSADICRGSLRLLGRSP